VTNARQARTNSTPIGCRGRALIIGGSLSGLFAALLLRGRGWEVDVYERAETELAGRGAGIVTHQMLWDALDAIGIDWRDNLGVDVATRRMFALDGRLILELACPQTMTAWDRVYAMLRDAYPTQNYHGGKELARIQQCDDEVTAIFADGTSVSGDLLVGCDGLRSTVRKQVLPETVPIYAGYAAWRGLVPESAFSSDLHHQLFMHMAFCLPPGEQMLGYPVAGPGNDLRPGRRRYNLVWYRPAEAHTALKRLLTDDRGVTHQISIPPPAVSRAVIADMREAAERVLAPQFRECWRIAEQPFLQAIYDVQSPRLAFGRVTIMGDASYVARPHCAAGVAKAADDAVALAQALSSERSIDTALRKYEAARVPLGCRIVGHARRLGSYLQSQIKTTGERLQPSSTSHQRRCCAKPRRWISWSELMPL
jgi:2-polyprenyl-6-methoxyphenol hydroxylase-like FAD-dependent oxidoreductase